MTELAQLIETAVIWGVVWFVIWIILKKTGLSGNLLGPARKRLGELSSAAQALNSKFVTEDAGVAPKAGSSNADTSNDKVTEAEDVDGRMVSDVPAGNAQSGNALAGNAGITGAAGTGAAVADVEGTVKLFKSLNRKNDIFIKVLDVYLFDHADNKRLAALRGRMNEVGNICRKCVSGISLKKDVDLAAETGRILKICSDADKVLEAEIIRDREAALLNF